MDALRSVAQQSCCNFEASGPGKTAKSKQGGPTSARLQPCNVDLSERHCAEPCFQSSRTESHLSQEAASKEAAMADEQVNEVQEKLDDLAGVSPGHCSHSTSLGGDDLSSASSPFCCS